MDSLSQLIGQRFALARGRSVSQEELAKVLGFKDRQTVSAIEVGERKITTDELLAAARFFDKPIEFFTDPYLVPEKTGFSYRAKTLKLADVLGFENQAERLISAQRRFRTLLNEAANPVHAQLPELTKSTPLTIATQRGEQLAAVWKLGDVPARRLRQTAEERLGVSILFVDAPYGVSGAACFLSDGSTVLVNRREYEGRRNFTIGHELFHLLTWNEMPPERFDYEDAAQNRTKTEILADNFTSGLLMPSNVLLSRWAEKGRSGLGSWLQQHAAEMDVSASALYWRLVNLDLVDKDEEPYPAPRLCVTRSATPPLYNAGFVTGLHRVLERGHLTVTRALNLLDCSIGELAGLFKEYELAVPFDL